MISQDVLNYFKGSKSLVTGGTGLIGRQVVDILVDAGSDVVVASLDNIQINEKATFEYLDLCNYKDCREITSNVDFVFHIAGIKGSVQVTKVKPASFFVPMLQMNTNILEAARKSKIEKLVYVSSVGAYSSAEVFKESENREGQPMDSFPGWAKRMAELQIKAYKIQYGMNNFSVVRPTNVYGPGDNFDPNNAMVIPSLMYRIRSGEDPLKVWGDGSAIRDFAYSKDVAEGIVLALHYGTNSDFVNLGSGIGYTIRELVEALNNIVNFDYVFDDSKSSGFPKRVMDISLAKNIIHYNPTTSLQDGLEQTWDWFVNNQNEYLKKQNYFKEEVHVNISSKN
tara:strand:- start:1548 stop:2564 length:1017 start_codon:yes stop_codon:yes gene_type:complete